MKVLLAVDGSETSQAAVRAVRERPWPEGTVVRVLSVAEPVYTMPQAPFDLAVGTAQTDPMLGTQALMEQFLEHAQRVAEKTAHELRAQGLHAEPVTAMADARAAIVDHARDWGADLIVVGSHGRTGLKRWILGSVAESVVRHAPCSVEVARVR